MVVDFAPQMLSVKRANPDVLLMWPNSGEDHALIIKARDELGWTAERDIAQMCADVWHYQTTPK